MKMEAVEAELKQWGELFIMTEGGITYEIHLGDTTFDYEHRVIRLQAPDGTYVIAGDSVESVKKHYGHIVDE